MINYKVNAIIRIIYWIKCEKNLLKKWIRSNITDKVNGYESHLRYMKIIERVKLGEKPSITGVFPYEYYLELKKYTNDKNYLENVVETRVPCKSSKEVSSST